MRVILHIGTEKTGTTSFQKFCHRNRAALLEQGILYPRELGGESHRHISIYGLSFGAADDGMRGLDSPEAVAKFHTGIETRLARQLNQAPGARICILSSEHLHSRLNKTDEIRRVRELLTRHFDEIEVHVHLRAQVDVLVSLASTQSRVGGGVHGAFFGRARPDRMYYNYDALVSAWEDVFGADKIVCLPYRIEPDYLRFLSARIEMDRAGLPVPERVNEALDVRVMAMTNALIASGTSQRIDFRVLDALPVEQRLKLDNATARRIQARFQESNQALVARRPDLEPGQIQPDWSRYPETGNLDILETPCIFAGSLASLVEHYNAGIAQARTQTAPPS